SVMDIPAVWRGYAEWVRERHPGKPLLAAEAGASGLSGWRRPVAAGGIGGLEMWSEDLQAAIVGATVAATAASGFAGIALWQFSDCRIDEVPFLEDHPPGSYEESQYPMPLLLNASEGAHWIEK
ncbi:unnamed protein product, partial [Polarella glacialis]